DAERIDGAVRFLGGRLSATEGRPGNIFRYRPIWHNATASRSPNSRGQKRRPAALDLRLNIADVARIIQHEIRLQAFLVHGLLGSLTGGEFVGCPAALQSPLQTQFARRIDECYRVAEVMPTGL